MGFAKTSRCLSGHNHPSKSEADYCNRLLAKVQWGEIKSYRLYPSLKIFIDGKLWKIWKADFEVTENDGSLSIHESKGWNRSDDSFRLKLGAYLLQDNALPVFVNGERVTGAFGRRGVKTQIKRKKRLSNRVNRFNRQKKLASYRFFKERGLLNDTRSLGFFRARTV